MGELYRKLREYGQGKVYPYHMPGHKRKQCGEMPKEITGIDITEIEGFDNLHCPCGLLKELQKRAARLYGAEESFYLVNGSTGGILSAVSGALPAGGHILMSRNCHKSVYHGAYLRNLAISYLYPDILEAYDINEAVTPKQVEQALERETDIGAVLIVSPTYEGRIADVKEIARIVHEKGIPLIVDEAHGAHLGFSEAFAPNSCACGADIVIHSVHKTLPSMTQTALLHVNGDRVDREQLKRFLHIYQTSSPSYVLMASIDNALEWMAGEGRQKCSSFAESYLKMCERLSACRGLQFLPSDSRKQDIGKLVISGKKIRLSGQQIYDILLREYQLQLEMAAGSYCLAMFTAADEEEAYERMTKALLELDERILRGEFPRDREEAVQAQRTLQEKEPGKAIPFCRAWDMKTEIIPLEQAIGRYAGEFINLYPPGTPLLVPGEVFDQEAYRLIFSYLNKGLKVQGVSENNERHASRATLMLNKSRYFIKVLVQP